MKNGKLVEQVQTPWGVFNVTCFERVPGENLEDVADSFTAARGYGETLGQLHALDVARAMDALKKMVKDSEVQQAEDDFLQGYRAHSVFDWEQQNTLLLMRRLVCLQEYAGLLHVMSEPVANQPEWMEKLVEKLMGRLRSLEVSMQK